MIKKNYFKVIIQFLNFQIISGTDFKIECYGFIYSKNIKIDLKALSNIFFMQKG